MKKSASISSKILGILILLAVVGWQAWQRTHAPSDNSTNSSTPPASVPTSDRRPSIPPPTASRDAGTTTPAAPSDGADRIARAFRVQASGEQIRATGKVKKMLPDDNDGDRHQRAIIVLSNKRTILIAHNIDLAPRVPWREGDTIEFYGEYEWSEEGGVMHWTHHDPARRHVDGWIKLDGKVYK
ncbi:MAG: DUF3465 domain-containing protein [Phycisphaerales bacterium]|nr:MAG: DUF3465 domain-containing protein [Phycisphaerales bacterium]